MQQEWDGAIFEGNLVDSDIFEKTLDHVPSQGEGA